MAKYRIETPDGQVYEIDGPDGASDDEIVAVTRRHVGKVAPGKFDGAGVNVNKPQKAASLTSMSQQGLGGISDEVAGASGVLYNAIKSPFSSATDFDPSGAYQEWRDRERGAIETARKESPWASGAAELSGSLVGPAGITRGATTLGGAMKTAAKGGAALGGISGWGYGEGLGGSLASGGAGTVLGGAFGAILPLAYRMMERPIRAGMDFMRPRNGVGRELVGRAMRDDGVAPSMAAERLRGAQQNGVPLGLMDLGDNLRGMTGALSRKPGVARTLVRDAVVDRQAGQGERVRGAIQRDLGPVVNTAEQSDALIQQARTAAAPLYDEFYKQPGRSSPALDAMMQTSAGRQALARAGKIADNEQRDPGALGFDLDQNGETTLRQVASPQTLDLVKRGLDDVVEEFRDPVTRQMNLNEDGRAINALRGRFVGEVDRLYPDYAAARQAYQGPARERQALESGRSSLNASAEEIERMMAGMVPGQMDQFALGHRGALAEMLDRRVDGSDKAHAILGTPRKRAALGGIYEGRGDFGRFSNTLADEGAAAETYRAVNTGSQTSGRLADDEMISDPSLLEDVATRAIRGGQNGASGIVAEGIAAMRDINRFGAGATGQRAREDAAALLSNTDPDLMLESLRASLRDAARRRMQDGASRRVVAGGGILGGRLLGGASGYSMGLEQP